MPDWSKFLGIPFVDRGRDPAVGLDCGGLFILAMREFNIEVPDHQTSCFSSLAIQQAMSESLWMWEPVDTPGPGVAVALAINEEIPGVVQHFGVCIDKRRFIHTLAKVGVIVTPLDHPFYRKKIKGLYRWRNQG